MHDTRNFLEILQRVEITQGLQQHGRGPSGAQTVKTVQEENAAQENSQEDAKEDTKENPSPAGSMKPQRRRTRAKQVSTNTWVFATITSELILVSRQKMSEASETNSVSAVQSNQHEDDRVIVDSPDEYTPDASPDKGTDEQTPDQTTQPVPGEPVPEEATEDDQNDHDTVSINPSTDIGLTVPEAPEDVPNPVLPSGDAIPTVKPGADKYAGPTLPEVPDPPAE